jgi:hypothetical protein
MSGLLAAVVLAGCGGSGLAGPQSEIEATIHGLAGKDPSKCVKAMTPKFLEQGLGKRGKVALRKCREERADRPYPIRSVAVSRVEVHGDTATADAAFSGGGFDGQTVVLSLLRKGGRWRVDRALRVAALDRPRLIAALVRTLRTDPEKHDPGQIACIAQAMIAAPRGELEGVFLHTSEAKEIKLIRRCPKAVAGATPGRRIEFTLAKLLTGRDPDACLELATQRFLVQAYRKHGKAALEACLEEIHGRLGGTTAVRLANVELGDRGATADVEALGVLGLEGQVIAMSLVERDGNWKADRILGLARIDRQGFAKALLKEFGALGIEVTRPIAACVKGEMRRIPRSQVEALLLRPNTSRGRRLFSHCLGEAPPQLPAPL